MTDNVVTKDSSPEENVSFGNLTFSIKKDHPDFSIAERHCYESRRLRNGVNAVLRQKYFFYRFGDDADLTISDELGFGDTIRKGELSSSKNSMVSIIMPKVVDKQDVKLPAKVAQSIVRSLHGSWQSFYSLRKKKLPANIPGYSTTYHVAEYNSQCLSKHKKNKGRIIPTGWSTGVKLPQGFTGRVKSAKLVHQSNDCFELHVLYEKKKQIKDKGNKNKNLIASVDPGLNNLMTIAFSDLREGIIVDGNPLKEINSYYNHVINDLKSKLGKEEENVHKKNKQQSKENGDDVRKERILSRKLDNLWLKRSRKMKHYYTTATNAAVNMLCEAGVSTVIIGWNKGIKDKSNMGRKNNRKFVSIPLKKILDDFARKLKEAQIEVVWQEESYTSKSSFLDNDEIPTYGDNSLPRVFSGTRITRGTYKSKDGILINADLNGALNILKKYLIKNGMRLENYSQFGELSLGTIASRGCVVPSVRRISFNV